MWKRTFNQEKALSLIVIIDGSFVALVTVNIYWVMYLYIFQLGRFRLSCKWTLIHQEDFHSHSTIKGSSWTISRFHVEIVISNNVMLFWIVIGFRYVVLLQKKWHGSILFLFCYWQIKSQFRRRLFEHMVFIARPKVPSRKESSQDQTDGFRLVFLLSIKISI